MQTPGLEAQVMAMLITDSGLDADVAARLEAAGPTVVRA
jgi:hypothetical protein